MGHQLGAQEPWGICWEALGTQWGINQEPGNALRNLLGGRGDGLGDQPGARERLGGPAGKPWGRLGGSTGSPGTPWGTAWEAVRRLGGPTGGLGTPRGTCWKALGTPWRTPWRTNRWLGNAFGNPTDLHGLPGISTDLHGCHGCLGGSTGSPGTPWGIAWEAVGTPWRTNGGLGNASGKPLESLGDALEDLLGTPWRTLGRTSLTDFPESSLFGRTIKHCG